MPADAVPSREDEDVVIRVAWVNAVCVVSILGEVDLVTAMIVQEALGKELEARPAGLVADLSGVGFFGSSGLSALVATDNRGKELEVPFAVVAGRREVLRPIEVTGLDELLDVRASVAEAVAGLTSST